MGLEEKEATKEIGGVNYKMLPLPFGIGAKALRRFVAVASPLIAAAMSGGGVASYAAIFEALPGAISDDDVTYFAELFGARSHYQDGDRWVPLVAANRETHFAMRYLDFIKWIGFGVNLNFQDILSGGGKETADLMATLMTRAA